MKYRKKIFIIAPSGFGSDGITSYIMSNYRKFEHTKLDITIGITKIYGSNQIAEKMISEIQSEGDRVVRLDRSGKKIIQYCIQFMKILRKEKFDVIHVHGSSSLIWLELKMAELCGVKQRIAHSHNTRTKHPFFHKVLRKKLYQTATDYFACGNLAGKWMYGEKPYVVMANGIDTQKFQFDELDRINIRKELNLDEETFVLGHIGNFNLQKNQKFLIDILFELKNRISNIKLCMVGRGKMMDEIVEYAKEKGCMHEVLFLGQRTDVMKLLQAMDVFLLPSLYEGFPIVAVEAQTSGLPLIASDNITREIALTDNISFCPIDNGTESWVKSIEECMKLYRDRKKYAHRIYDAGYDISVTTQKLQQLYLTDTNF